MSYQTARTVGKVLEDIYVVKTRRLPEGTIMRDILVNGTDVNLDTVWKTDVRAGRNVALIFEAHRELYDAPLADLSELSTEFKLRRRVE